MLNLIIGLVLGGMLGVICTSLMVIASDADDWDESVRRDRDGCDRSNGQDHDDSLPEHQS